MFSINQKSLVNNCFAAAAIDAQTESTSTWLYDPLSGTAPSQPEGTIEELVGKVIKAMLGLFGSLALLMFVYGGLLWITSMGNADKVKKGTDTIKWATAAIVIIFASYAIIEFVFSLLSG